MDANAAPAAVLDARLSPVWRVQLALRDDASAQKPAPAPQKSEPPPPVQLIASEMLIQVDKASGRFVSTVIDPDTQEILRQYPSETQLAYSRAVRAYLAAQTAP